MTTLSAQAFDPNLECQEDEIVLIGRPDALKGILTLDNRTGEQVFVRELQMKTSKRSALPLTQHLNINTVLQPGEVRAHRSRLALDPSTPPGTYFFQLQVGAKERTLRLVVNPHVALSCYPTRVQLIGTEPGQTHMREFQLTNNGNLDYRIPNIQHNLVENRDLMCRNLSLATQAKAKEGIESWFNRLLQGISTDIDWLKIEIAEAGQIIPPSETRLIHIVFTLPATIRPDREYEGQIRLHERVIYYTIHPAASAEDLPPKEERKKASPQ